MVERQKYAELHLHSLDQFDSDNKPEAVCKRLVELGAKGFALTQHGVLSGIEPMRDAAKKYDLKFIPGIETYYGNEDDIKKNKHLILLSVNYDGYKSIWKAVSDKNVQNTAGQSIMNQDILKKYFGPGTAGHGNVIATSACINGVIAACLRFNEVLQNEIEKIERKILKYDCANERMISLSLKVNDLEQEISDAISTRNTLKPIAEARFLKREKAVEKLKDANDSSYDAERSLLEKDKKDSEQAKKELEKIKKNITSLKSKKTVFSKELREIKDKASKENLLEKQILDLKDKMISSDELYSMAVEETKKMISIFGENNFYIEIQNHGIPKEAEIYPVLVDIARELNIPIVATNDVHTVTNSDEELLRRQILKALRFEEWEEQQIGDDQLYIKTDAEMVEWLSKIFDSETVNEAMENIKVIFDRCDVQFPEVTHYPVFASKSGKTSKEIFIEEIKKGIEWRFPNGIDEKYKNRLNAEYKVISSMGYIDYHLIVKDFLEYGRVLAAVPENEIQNAPLDIEKATAWVNKNGWKGGFSTGPGRGSAAGSLICYCLGITNIDPFKYDLLFERFLNPERVSMPDIDSDLANRIRGKVIEYVKAKYGKESVCGIMTTNAQAPRGAIRIAAKYYGLSINKPGHFLSLSDKMAKFVPNEPGISFNSEIQPNVTVEQSIITEFNDNPDALTILKWAKVIEGCFTVYGAHAAGIVISDGLPVDEYLPLRWNNKLQEMTTQVDMVKVEEKGLIKMDFLGLKTLDIITDCIRMIYENKGILIDPLQIPTDDENIYREIFAKARTNSVFQFESDGMKNMLKRFRPSNFEDLIILVSMFRPGPLQYIDNVIDVKNGKTPLTFVCPELQPILGKTYGGIVYQEQVMEIFQKLAGYTLGGADEVRRAMSKKKLDKILHEKNTFIYGDFARGIDGCVNRGIDEHAAEQLFDQMTDFAKYAFNKSHAAAYATNSYYTAWLKYYYPTEFLASALNWAEKDDIPGLIQEANSFGIKVLSPDINFSEKDFSISDNNIRFGLSSIKTVGASAEEIISERHLNGLFGSLQEFLERTNIRKNSIEALIKAGAFDSFNSNRRSMLLVIDEYKVLLNKIAAKVATEKELAQLLKHINSTSEVDIMKAAEELSISDVTIGKTPTKEKLQKKIDNTKKSIADLQKKISEIVLIDEEENLIDRLKDEKDVMEIYLSGHPLDAYDSPDKYGAFPISTLISNYEIQPKKKIQVLAVINSVKVKLDKNNCPFAILEVEDKTSSLSVLIWSEQYVQYKDLLSEGNVVLISGKLNRKISFMDENAYEYSINVENINTVAYKTSRYIIKFATEESFKKIAKYLYDNYRTDDGHNWIAYIADKDIYKNMSFRLAGECKKFGGVVEA